MTRPIRVLSLSTLFPDASRPNFGIFVERSLAALSRQPDIDLTIVAPLPVPPWPVSLHPKYRERRGVPRAENWRGVDVLRPRWRLWPGLGAAGNGAAVANAVLRAVQDRGPFDVVDAQFFHPDAVAAQRVAATLGLPYSVKARGNDIQLWANRADTGPAIVSAAAGATGLLAVSRALRAEMVDAGMNHDQIRIHYTGVDPERFCVMDRAAARAALGVGDGPVLLTVGTLNANKGQHLVIDALADLPGVTHLIAGIGPDHDALLAQAQAAGVADRVRLLGSVPNADLGALYNAADIMVLTSLKEGLANAWVEAMACGTPIITADIPPAQEAIDAPDAGRVVAREAGAIVPAVQELLSAPPDRHALSARTHARFNWDRHAEELAAHLHRIARK